MKSLIYIALLLAITGCSYSNSQIIRGLEETESLIYEDAGAAMERLNEYDVTEFTDSATLAKWALLYSQALVANNILAPTDTIVDIAVSYYGAHNIKDEFRHASRLKAILMSNGERDALSTALYLQKEKEFMLYKERIEHNHILLGGIFIVIIATGIIIWLRQRLRIRDHQNEILIAEASNLRDGLMKNQSACSELQLKLEDALNSRFETIDQLCGIYYESQGTKGERKAIADKVKMQIEELKSDKGLFTDMEKCVNDCRDGMLDHIKNEWPDIKPDDYRMIIYLACCLSNRTIALLLGENIEVVYKRKSRLKAKINARESAYKEQLMTIF